MLYDFQVENLQLFVVNTKHDECGTVYITYCIIQNVSKIIVVNKFSNNYDDSSYIQN